MLYFFHGLESNPNGFKATRLRQQYPHMIAPALPKNPWQRHNILTPLIQPGAVIIGSSLGGLSALMMAAAHPSRVKGMVLLAPAVGLFEKREPEIHALMDEQYVPKGIPTIIVAGIYDSIIPMAAIEDMIARSEGADVRLEKVNEDHRLNGEEGHRVMMASVAEVLEKIRN